MPLVSALTQGSLTTETLPLATCTMVIVLAPWVIVISAGMPDVLAMATAYSWLGALL